MYVKIGSHVASHESKFLLVALVIVRITLNVIVRQMSTKQRCVHPSNTSTTFSQQVEITLSKCVRSL